jgi:hypothetical protein
MYLKVNSSVRMRRIGSEFDIDSFEYTSELSGYSFNRKIWKKGFKLFVNKDNGLKFEDEKSELVAVCESY